MFSVFFWNYMYQFSSIQFSRSVVSDSLQPHGLLKPGLLVHHQLPEFTQTHIHWGFPGGSDCKASACNAGDQGSIPRSGRSPGEGNGNPLQYSCLENSMDGGAWWATVHGVAKSQTRLSDFTFTLFQIHWVGDAIQPSHPLLSPSPPTFNLSQHQGLFKWVKSLHQVAKILEFQLQHQSFQWIFRTDFL